MKEDIKYLKKLQRDYDRKVKWFWWKLKIKKNLTSEEINNMVLKFVSEAKSYDDLEKVYLSSDQFHDKEFMMNLYKANSGTLVRKRFAPCDEFLDDYEYMTDYIKMRHDRSKVKGIDSKNLANTVTYSTYDYPGLMEKKEFVEMLSAKIPEVNMLSVLKNPRFYGYYLSPYGWKQAEKKYKEFVNTFSQEMLSQQAKNFGSQFLEYLPEDNENYISLVGDAVEKDGFKSLKYLPVDAILDNKDMIRKATELQGNNFLVYYINSILNPERAMSYEENPDLQGHKYYDKRYEKVQKELLNDSEIVELLSGRIGLNYGSMEK